MDAGDKTLGTQWPKIREVQRSHENHIFRQEVGKRFETIFPVTLRSGHPAVRNPALKTGVFIRRPAANHRKRSKPRMPTWGLTRMSAFDWVYVASIEIETTITLAKSQTL
jgi:hypothetical protein